MTPEMSQTGVYAIRCLVNDKRYVGSAARSFHYRWNKHQTQLKLGTHHSKPLQLAWKKHGEASFVFEILVICEPNDCVAREQEFIDKYNSTNRKCGYNVCPLAGSSLGYKHTAEAIKKFSEQNRGKKRSPETLEKMAAWQRGRKRPPFSEEWKRKLGDNSRGCIRSAETRAKISAAKKGKKCSPEHCAAMSAAKRGKKRKPLTPEHRAKCSAAKKGIKRPQHVIDAMNQGRREKRAMRLSSHPVLFTLEES